VVPSSETPVLREVKVVHVRTKNKSKVKAMEVRAAARPRTDRTDGIKVECAGQNRNSSQDKLILYQQARASNAQCQVKDTKAIHYAT
jgi:hypothetical protein